MAHLTPVKRLAKKFGATVDVKSVGKWTRVNVDAPAGKTWDAADLHCLMAEWLIGDPVYREQSLADLLERMALGVSQCDDEECDVCHPE